MTDTRRAMTNSVRDARLACALNNLRGRLTFGGRPSNNPGRDMRDTLLRAIDDGRLVPFPAREHRRPTKAEEATRKRLEARLVRALRGNRPIPADLRELLAQGSTKRRGRGRPRADLFAQMSEAIKIGIIFDAVSRAHPRMERRLRLELVEDETNCSISKIEKSLASFIGYPRR
jgi:hypothetical protein